jgi:hypothetical protein
MTLSTSAVAVCCSKELLVSLNNRIGREFSLEGMLESYTHRKNVTVNLTH